MVRFKNKQEKSGDKRQGLKEQIMSFRAGAVGELHTSENTLKHEGKIVSLKKNKLSKESGNSKTEKTRHQSGVLVQQCLKCAIHICLRKE